MYYEPGEENVARAANNKEVRGRLNPPASQLPVAGVRVLPVPPSGATCNYRPREKALTQDDTRKGREGRKRDREGRRKVKEV